MSIIFSSNTLKLGRTQNELNKYGNCVRKLQNEDYEKYVSLLSQLTDVGNITKKIFCDRLEIINKNPNLYIMVIVDNYNNELISAGTIYIEPKFIHECSKIGHIEDIVVNNKYRGQNYGKHIIRLLLDIAKRENCYKVTLACKEKNIGFYNKCGFKLEGYEMVARL